MRTAFPSGSSATLARIALLVLLAPVACSGEDDGSGGKGSGVSSGGSAGAAGTSGLGVGGRAGSGAKAGEAGQAGQAGQAGASPAGGQAGAAGEAGKGGAGQAGQAGQGGSGPVAPVCGDGVLQASELCEGTGKVATCGELFGDASPASEEAICGGCYADTSACLPFANGRLDVGRESDIDCGGEASARCALGFSCNEENDCDLPSGLHCLAGICNEATVIATTQKLAANPGVPTTNGVILRTALPLPSNAVVTFDAVVTKPSTGDVTAVPIPVPVPDPVLSGGRHGRRGAVTFTTSNVPDSTLVAVEYRATIKSPKGEIRLSSTAGELVVFPKPAAGAALSVDLHPGSCLVTGPQPMSFPTQDGAFDAPVGLPVCVTINGLPASSPLTSLRIGNHDSTAVDSQRRTVVMTDQPLSEGLPATALLDVVFTYGSAVTEHHIFPQAVRATALTITGTASPATMDGLGLPGSPRYMSAAFLGDGLPDGTHLQLVDTLEITEPFALPGRLDGYAKGVLQLRSPTAGVFLRAGTVLQDVTVTAKNGSAGAACLSTPTTGARPLVRGVSIDTCKTGLAAPNDVLVSETNVDETTVAMAIGPAGAAAATPPTAHVLGGTVTASQQGISVTNARASVRGARLANAVVGLTIGENANVSVVSSKLENDNLGLNVVGTTGKLLIAGGSIVGEGKDPPGLGLAADGGANMVVTVRGVAFSELQKHAIRLAGPNTVEVYGGSITTSGSPAIPAMGGTAATPATSAIDARQGKLRLLGTTLTGTNQTLVTLADSASGSQHGVVEILAGARLEGGDRGIVAEGASELRVQDTRFRGASVHALDVRTKGAWSLARTFLVSSNARAANAALLNIDTGVATDSAKTFDAVRLQAGAGQTLLSAGTQCTSYADPLGGPYLQLATPSEVCF